MYIDESYNSKADHIVMSGLTIPLNKWNETNKKIEDLKRKYFKNQSMNLKAIRRKGYDQDSYWNSLSKQKQDEFNQELYDIICDKEHIIIAGLIVNSKMKDRNKELLFTLCYSFILERFEYFLDSKDSEGLIVIDKAESSKEVMNLQRKHSEYLKNGIPVKREDTRINIKGKDKIFKRYMRREIKRVCESILFLDDKSNNFLQLADIISYAIACRYNSKKESWYFNKIKGNIRCSSKGEIMGYGLKFFP